MSRAGWALTTLATAAAAGAGGYWVGQHGVPAPDSLLVHVPALPAWVGKMLPALRSVGALCPPLEVGHPGWF
jgi:hypothetical protein